MTEQEAEELKPDYEMRGQQIEDEALKAVKQRRWDAPLLVATGEINARDSPLLRLPAEIRNRIYGYVLGPMYIYPNVRPANQTPSPYPPLLVCDCDGARDQLAHGRRTACWPQRLYYYLLCTCRQIYTEAFPIFWSTNTFCFEHSAIMSSIFQKWLPHQTALIRNVRLDIKLFVLDDSWKKHLKGASLESLQRLEQIHIVTHSGYTSFIPPRRNSYKQKMERRKSSLVKMIYEMLAHQPTLAMFVVRDGRFYRRLGSKSTLGNLLEQL